MKERRIKILIAEDDLNIGLGLEELLVGEGFEVSRVDRGDLVVSRYDAFAPDLLVLDVMLPERDGLEICKELRGREVTIPILMLTAKSEEIDKVRGLEIGADDYLTKPFGVRELLARVQALLRRSRRMGGGSAGQSDSDELGSFAIGDARVDPKTYLLERSGETTMLTEKELKLMQFFSEHRGEVLSRDRLLNAVWGYHYTGNTRTLDQVVVRIRRLIGEPEGQPRFLRTVHGTGYRLVE